MWRPKGHFDQHNPLGTLLPSSCLFSPQRSSSSGAICSGSRGEPAGAFFSFYLCSSLDSYGRGQPRFPSTGKRSGGIALACIGQHQLRARGSAELQGLSWSTAGSQLQESAGRLGAGPWGHRCAFLDSRHRHEPDLLKSDNKTHTDTRNRGSNTCPVH